MVNYETFLEFHKNIIGGAGQSYEEAYDLCNHIIKSNQIEGVIVEVGVANGGSAQILNNYKTNDKKLFLFDTFEGLKDCLFEFDGGDLYNGMMTYEETTIINLFKNQNVQVVKGYFPKSAIGVLDNLKISFLHLDVDTYQSTLNGLKYCYDKINTGGVIIIHDYINNESTKGVTLAVDEFFSEKKEKIIIPNGGKVINGHGNTHCIIIKE